MVPWLEAAELSFAYRGAARIMGILSRNLAPRLTRSPWPHIGIPLNQNLSRPTETP